MSILADFFVSTPEEAIQYASGIEVHLALKATLQPFETNGLTPLDLGTGQKFAALTALSQDHHGRPTRGHVNRLCAKRTKPRLLLA